MTTLFDPVKLGAIAAPNRILMAPLTRGRSSREHVPDSGLMAEYYGQRASAGLIISEATGISREGLGWPYAPGIWSREQVEAWRPVVKAVHDKGGRIVSQLWHMGRMVHPDVTGLQPVSASATTAPGHAHTYSEKKPYPEARALEVSEIPRILEAYEVAARNALEAGFDGVQIHAANGYLIDEFLRDGTNKRTDEYGGEPENRIRLLREVTERVISVVGKERVSVRLSPNGDTQGTIDSDPQRVFVPAAKMLSDLGIAWLELREVGPDGTFGKTDQPKLSPVIRQVFDKPLVLNQDYSLEEAEMVVAEGKADAISFGRKFLANPDLPHRFEAGLPLNEDEMKTWYSRGPEGYVDYPAADGN